MEWYHDTKTGDLLFVTNSSTAPTNTFEAPVLKTLFDLRGTQADPVRNVTFSGLVFTGTAYTYLDPHSPPSGGDWSFQRSGAIFLEGTTGVTIKDSRLERLDGNGILISGFNQCVRLQHAHPSPPPLLLFSPRFSLSVDSSTHEMVLSESQNPLACAGTRPFRGTTLRTRGTRRLVRGATRKGVTPINPRARVLTGQTATFPGTA